MAGQQVAMGKRHNRRTGSQTHRRETILAEKLRIGDGDWWRTRKPPDAQAFPLPVLPLQPQRNGNPAGQARRCESEVSDGDHLVSCGAPRAPALRIVAPDTRRENPARRVEFTRWNVQN